jgi:hypothetical protein
MKKIGRLKKFWNRLEALSNTGKVVLVFSLLLVVAMCSREGLEWYYQSYPDRKVDDVASVVFISICMWIAFLAWLLRQIFDFQKKKIKDPKPGSKIFIFMFLLLSSINGGFPAWILLFVIVLQIIVWLVKLVQKLSK